MKNLRFALLAVIALCSAGLGSAGLASATPIGPNCASCQGGVYDLTYSTISIGAVNDVYNVFLNVNTDTYTGGGLYIQAVAPKVANSIVAVTPLSAPALSGGASWTTMNGGLDANGCSGSGSGFICTQSTGLGALLSTDINNTHVSNTWSWQITVAHGALFTAPGAASIKVLFTDASGNKVGALVSEPITLSGSVPPSEVPEPSSYAMIGVGLTGLALASRKLRRS